MSSSAAVAVVQREGWVKPSSAVKGGRRGSRSSPAGVGDGGGRSRGDRGGLIGLTGLGLDARECLEEVLLIARLC